MFPDLLSANLAVNELDQVKVRINQYDPFGEWQRLGANRSVSWPVRYSLGTLAVVGYTVLPGRRPCRPWSSDVGWDR